MCQRLGLGTQVIMESLGYLGLHVNFGEGSVLAIYKTLRSPIHMSCCLSSFIGVIFC